MVRYGKFGSWLTWTFSGLFDLTSREFNFTPAAHVTSILLMLNLTLLTHFQLCSCHLNFIKHYSREWNFTASFHNFRSFTWYGYSKSLTLANCTRMNVLKYQYQLCRLMWMAWIPHVSHSTSCGCSMIIN